MLFKIHLGSVKSTYPAERQTQRSGFFSNLQQLQSSLLLPKNLYARRREQGSKSPRLLPGHTRDTWQGLRWSGSSHRESCVNRAKLEDLMNEMERHFEDKDKKSRKVLECLLLLWFSSAHPSDARSTSAPLLCHPSAL